jgi:hypothetical protein
MYARSRTVAAFYISLSSSVMESARLFLSRPRPAAGNLFLYARSKVPGTPRRAAKALAPPVECNARWTWPIGLLTCEPVWMLLLNTLQ